MKTTMPARNMRARGGPLQGVRVVELTKVWAGPYAGKLLAFLGAEVIRVEPPFARPIAHMDVSPAVNEGDGGDAYNRVVSYNDLQRSKLGITLDLSKPHGRDVLLRLATISDVVIENMAPRVLPRGVGVAAPDCLPELGVACAPERAPSDEPVAAVREEELEPGDRHERAEHAHGAEHPARRLEELLLVRRRVLDRDDVVDGGDPLGQVGADVDARPVRPVVDHQRRVDAARDVLEVPDGLVGIRLRVRRRRRKCDARHTEHTDDHQQTASLTHLVLR